MYYLITSNHFAHEQKATEKTHVSTVIIIVYKIFPLVPSSFLIEAIAAYSPICRFKAVRPIINVKVLQ